MKAVRHDRRWAGSAAKVFSALLVVASLGAMAGSAHAQAVDARSQAAWASLKTDVFEDREISVDDGLVRIQAPKRAQDAAIVPVDIFIDPARFPGGVKTLTLIVDMNPSPVAATFQFGENAGVTHLSTRLRVDDYSYLRAIAETGSGQLHMAQTFVKASGGCSAPAVKNQTEAEKTMGQMKLRQFAAQEQAGGKRSDLQLMIRHPNNSGLQKDPLTQYFIPPHFVHKLSVSQGERQIFSMEGGISISEDPNFRFDYTSDGKGEIRAEAIDTDGKVYHDQWPLEAAGL